MFAELLGLGSTLLGGLFGSKKKKESTTVDYVAMARNAERAGFNPLTALRNGGAAGFTTTVSHPGLSAMGDAVASIGGTLGAALDKKYDPIEQKRTAVDNALLDYQLKALQTGSHNLASFSGQPVRFRTDEVRQRKAPLGKASIGGKPHLMDGAVENWFSRPPEGDKGIPIWVKGVDRDGTSVWIPNPDGPDAEQMLFGVLSRAQYGAERFIDTAGSIARGEAVKMRKATDAENKRNRDSWHGGWLPSFTTSW